MFCPNCGKSDQQPDSYCRQCGNFLPDFEKLAKSETSPEQHLQINLVFNIFTAVTSLVLAVLLYAIFLGKEDTPFIIYLTAGFLTAMFAWNVQTTWRSILLKKQIAKQNKNREDDRENPQTTIESIPTNQLLNSAKMDDFVPASVTERTTKNLVKTKMT